jgi:hypothetical protein
MRCRRCQASFVLEEAERIGIAANDPHATSPGGRLDDREPESHRGQMPSKEQLAAPRVPSFESNVTPIRRYDDSLAPGASVFPQRGPKRIRTVPLSFALASSGLCLLIGGPLGVIVADLVVEPPPPSPVEQPEAVVAEPLASLLPLQVVEESSSSVMPTSERVEQAVPSDKAPRRTSSKAAKVAPDALANEAEAPGPLPDQLSAAHIQRTVHRNQPGIRHSCWNRALASRDPTAPSSVRVSVRIVIAPSGQVTQAVTGGEAMGYPGLAECVASRVRTWTFPRAGGSTKAALPFTFAAQ